MLEKSLTYFLRLSEIRVVPWIRVREDGPACRCRCMRDRSRNALRNEAVYLPIRSFHFAKKLMTWILVFSGVVRFLICYLNIHFFAVGGQSIVCPAVRTSSGWLDLFPLPCQKNSECRVMSNQHLCCKGFCTKGVKPSGAIQQQRLVLFHILICIYN